MKSNIKIRPREACDNSRFLELRSEVFGDDANFLQFFDNCFDNSYLDYVLIETSDGLEKSIQGALTQFMMGKLSLPKYKNSEPKTRSGLDGMNIEISYAICTDKNARGKGYGSYITLYAREVAESSRKLSMLSPAEPSLIDFYEPLNYKKFMYAEHDILDFSKPTIAGQLPTESLLNYNRLTAKEYNVYRESILEKRAHVVLSQEALKFVSESSCSGNGLILISENSKPLAIAAIDIDNTEILTVAEILTFSNAGGNYDLALKLCSNLTKAYKKSKCDYMFPADKDSKTKLALGLIAVSAEDLATLYDPDEDDFVPYMGFTFG